MKRGQLLVSAMSGHAVIAYAGQDKFVLGEKGDNSTIEHWRSDPIEETILSQTGRGLSHTTSSIEIAEVVEWYNKHFNNTFEENP